MSGGGGGGERRESQDLAYPSILSRHFERQFEQESEREITRFQSPNSKNSYIAEIQDQKSQSNSVRDHVFEYQERPGVVNIPVNHYMQQQQQSFYQREGEDCKVFYFYLSCIENSNQLNKSQQNDQQKPNAFLQVDKLDSSKWGIDIQQVCQFWASHKKQIIHLKQWHFSQKQ